MDHLAAHISHALGDVAFRKMAPEENDHEYTVFFPFSHFIEVFVFEMGQQQEGGGKADPVPVVEVVEGEYDEEVGAREVVVKCFHPEHFGTVLAFEADLISWSLAPPPIQGLKSHHIKHAGGFPANFWNVTLKFKAEKPTETSPKLFLHFTGVERNTYDALEPYTVARKPTGPVWKRKALQQWLWGNGFRSGQVLRRVQSAIVGYGGESGEYAGVEWSTEGYLASDQVTVAV
ncbi:hypothetical protein HDU98_008441 [Podochytrium sp. JEL0797]|nr:hypothetical protein HDU98_008441 [Podochytrium sp. JEL0797]